MRRTLHLKVWASIVAFASLGCSMLQPEVPVHGEYRLNWSDLREIERLLPVLGIHGPVDHVYMETADRASVAVQFRPIDSSRSDNEVLVFTAIRRAGHWVAIDRPRKEHLHVIAM